MKIFVLLVLLILSPLIGVVAKADQGFHEVDQQMITQLGLDRDQAAAYLQIIKRQRALFLSLEPGVWQQELALYRETFELLKPVLSAQQHAMFVGIVNSVIEFERGQERLALDGQSTQHY